MSDRKLFALCFAPFWLGIAAVGIYQVSPLLAGVMFCACFVYFPVVGFIVRRIDQAKAGTA